MGSKNAHSAPPPPRLAMNATYVASLALALACTLIVGLLGDAAASPATAVSLTPKAQSPKMPAPTAEEPASPPSYDVTTINPIGSGLEGVAVDPDRNLIYAVGRSIKQLLVLDADTLDLIRKVPLQGNPYRIAVGPAGHVYVTLPTTITEPGSLAVIAPGGVGKPTIIPAKTSTSAIQISPAGDRLYIAGYAHKSPILAYDLANPARPEFIRELASGGFTSDFAISADGSSIYAADYNSSRVHRINTTTGVFDGDWASNWLPNGVALTANEDRVIASAQGASTLAVIDTHTGAITSRIEANSSYYFASDPKMNSVFVTLPWESSVAVIDRTTGTLSEIVSGVPGAGSIAVNPKTHDVYVTSMNTRAFTRLSPQVKVQHPQPATVRDGDRATFAAGVSPVEPTGFAWQRRTPGGSWQEIAGASSAELVIDAATYAETGTEFRAVISGPKWTGAPWTTNPAELTVTPIAPSIIRQPTGIFALTGTRVSFRAQARGTEPMTVHWQQRGGDPALHSRHAEWVDIPGADTTVLTINGTHRKDGLEFRARFTNPGGSVETRAARLTVGEAEDPLDPVIPGGPTDPAAPVAPVGPEHPTDPAEPTDPSYPAAPADPVGPESPVPPGESPAAPSPRLAATGLNSNQGLLPALGLLALGALMVGRAGLRRHRSRG